MTALVPEQEALFHHFLGELSVGLNVLPDKSEENSHNTLCALWHAAAGKRVSPIAAIKIPLPILLPAQLSALEAFIRSRLSGVPLAHLTERQQFMGLEYIVDKGLYIPRKETELLARTAIASILNDHSSDEDVVAVDLCTGIGTVALAIGNYCINTRVFGSDIFGPAIDAARVNARHFQLEQRANFFVADLFAPFESLAMKGTVDIIVSAPPYISSSKVKTMAIEIADHEPEEAFDAGPFGLSVFNEIISKAPDYLGTNGSLMFECGLGQGEFLSKRINANGNYRDVAEIRDSHGHVRVLTARKV